MPVLLGEGVPLAQPGPGQKLVLSKHGVLENSGIVTLEYAVEHETS